MSMRGGTEQAHEHIVHQRGRLQRVVATMATQFVRRKSAQFVVDLRQQRIERSLIARLPLTQQLGDVRRHQRRSRGRLWARSQAA
ncbi:MAG: hypothetical protein IPO66_01540 [Rhodanobacteraceae bacterium]|nr:hypothetical protein [Rhodanobacteraceae bacterium]